MTRCASPCKYAMVNRTDEPTCGQEDCAMTICANDSALAGGFGVRLAPGRSVLREPRRYVQVSDLRNTVDAAHPTPHLPGRVGAARPWSNVTDPVHQLSDGQRDCLRLVYEHMTSKDIARVLGVSPHTVDMRLRTAMRTLGVDSRIDAARRLIDSEAGTNPYQPLIYQSPELGGSPETAIMGSPASATSDDNAVQHSDTRFSPDFGPSAAGPPRPAGAPLLSGGNAEGRFGERSYAAPLTRSVPWGARNDLGPGARLAWIAAIAIGSALGFGAILGALEALKHLL